MANKKTANAVNAETAETNGVETERDIKDKVIHTRVPDNLDEELKTRASHLGISVSNLVRNILTNAFDLVGDVIADSTNIGRAVSGPLPVSPAGTSRTPRVLGWQKLVLNVNAVCGRCNEVLPKGSEAASAVTDGPAAAAFLCLHCLKEI